eukprot:3482498-Amphidinium_carterae.1
MAFRGEHLLQKFAHHSGIRLRVHRRKRVKKLWQVPRLSKGSHAETTHTHTHTHTHARLHAPERSRWWRESETHGLAHKLSREDSGTCALVWNIQLWRFDALVSNMRPDALYDANSWTLHFQGSCEAPASDRTASE